MALGFRTGGMFGRQPLAMPAQGAMPIGVEQMQQKPGFFQRPGVKTAAGILGDTLLTLGGGQPMFGPMMHDRRMQEEDARLRQQLVQQQRMQKREDMQWEWQNKPKEVPNNDTINDFNWYSGLTEEQRKLYHQMKPVVGYMADGTPRIINPYEAQKPTMQPGVVEDGYRFKGGDPADPSAWEKVGGSGGNVTGGFRR